MDRAEMDERERRYGLNLHRLKDNPMEKRFSDAWHRPEFGRDEQYGEKTLSHILSHDNDAVFVNEDTKDFVATVIQWLGSPVGQGFLSDVLGFDVREYK